MDTSQIYMWVLIIILLAIIVIGLLMKKRKSNRPTPLTGIAFAFILAGIIFGNNRFVSYGLMGIGVLLAVIDVVMKVRKDRKKK